MSKVIILQVVSRWFVFFLASMRQYLDNDQCFSGIYRSADDIFLFMSFYLLLYYGIKFEAQQKQREIRVSMVVIALR